MDEHFATSVPDAARRLGIGRTLAFRLIAEGKLRAVKVAGRTVVPVSAIQDFLDRAPLARSGEGRR